MTAPRDRRFDEATYAGKLPASVRAEVLRDLQGTPRTLPPKLFYDARGAQLFEEICELDEYYLTRSELTILRERVDEIAALIGPQAVLVEYGSGAGVKVRMLLDALEAPAAYVPIDISTTQLASVSYELGHQYPGLAIHPIGADFTAPLKLPPLPSTGRRVAFFPGSTIGNFHPAEAAAFLGRVRRTLGANGAMVLGVDRRKDPARLEAAYDDARGVTAAFNLNMLARLNRDMGADFDLTAFRHRAPWNDEASRIEMHLESLRNQTVHIDGTTIRFARGETIWTESSYKYDAERLETVVTSAGFELSRLWSDANDDFWLTYLEVSARG
ncbi:MAG: L-histidine N(alpha)-methyltransferase [Cytophagaceae bacterium]|nr:L-histidine N(alpha)-methyltransferase [Gemmatimonadaceae bacterium]